MKIFYGKVKTKNGGVQQLRDNYLKGPVKWFGNLKKGDIAIISEDNRIHNIRKVVSIEKDKDDTNSLVYKFEKIFDEDFEPVKTASDILYTRYFKFDKASANLAYKQNAQNFNELTINEEYKDEDIKEFKFNTEVFNSIYFTENINKIQYEPRDYIIVVSNKEDGYQIKDVYEISKDGDPIKITLDSINKTLNIDKFGLKKAYEIENAKTFKKLNLKKNILGTIMQDIEKQGYYKHKHKSGLATIYDAMIIDPDEKPSKKQKETLSLKEDANDKLEENAEEANMDDEIVIYNLDSKLDLSSDICDYNLIFYGAPGCGKSYKVEKILEKNNIDEEHSSRILFYPDYSYTDFVGQLQPKVEKKDDNEKVTYKFKAGPFTQILKKALLDKENAYVLIIDEINRGNAPAIFGDIFQLLDRKKDGNSIYSIKNDLIKEYLKEDEGEGIVDIKDIFIPSNLYIFATMNTCDQNVFTLDTAFKRRWYFEKISNKFNNSDNKFTKELSNIKIEGLDITWKEFQESINFVIAEKLSIYGIDGEDKQLGKYFVTEMDLKNKRKFAHKVLMYLWNDAVRVDRSVLFEDNYKTLDKLIEAFVEEKGIDVFKKEVFKKEKEN